MTSIFHILGTDIPHHNHTILDFFQQKIVPQPAGQSHFFYVVSQRDLAVDFPRLPLTQFSSQQAIAKAIIAKKRQNPTACFILYGQFNPWIWLAIALGRLSTENLIWHIWGADLYETSTAWKFKLFYPLRRMAQRKLKQVWATKGDLHYLWNNIRARSTQDQRLYFPTKLPDLALDGELTQYKKKPELTLLLGNSGDRSNNHISALTHIQNTLGNKVRIIIPMGYPTNNENYIQQVEQHGKRLFCAENLQILRNKLSFNDYLALINECDLGYFNFERQQGIGTICLLIQHNIPCVLHPNNPFCLDMQAEKVPFLLHTSLNPTLIAETKQALSQKDKAQIRFFPPRYTQDWQKNLGYK